MEYLMNLQITSEKWYFIVPLILIIMDILTGLVHAWTEGNIKSYIMRQGLGKKFGEICYILLGILSKYVTGSSIIMIFLTCYISFMELLSLFENCAKLGVPMPEIIKEKLNNGNKEDK